MFILYMIMSFIIYRKQGELMFGNMSTDEMRNLVRHHLETLERWLRRLVDDALRAHYGGAFSALPIKQDIAKARRSHRMERQSSTGSPRSPSSSLGTSCGSV